jgi:molybdenum cofactor cytidylyltransferase
MPMPVAAIVLAAGESRRLGQPKQLLLLHGETLIARAVRLASEACADPVIAVLGSQHDLISNSIGASGATVVINHDWQLGISTSIHAGIQTLAEHAPESQGALVLGCDQPRLGVNHVRQLIHSFDAQSGNVIVASVYCGIQGIPAIFPRAAFSGLLALRGDRGARTLIANAPCAVVQVPFDGGEIDIDLPDHITQIS